MPLSRLGQPELLQTHEGQLDFEVSAGITTTKHNYVGPPSKRLSKAPNDPYWEPCLSYYRSWGPGACGR
jgi:hypothetical protein